MALVTRRGIEALGKAVLGMGLARFAQQTERFDAPDDGAPGIPRAAAIVSAAKAAVRAASSGLSAKVVKHSQNEFKRLGIKLRDVEPGLTQLVDVWRKQNVERVTSLVEFERDQLADILSEGANKTTAELRQVIEDRLEVSRSKADLLARDQVLTLNSQISHSRMQAAGIEQAFWTTANDARVRDSHEAMDGQLFDIDDPPEVDGEHVLPGEPVQCRCVSAPKLPELED